MVGGEPAGIQVPFEAVGCRTISTSINIMTIQGNNSTKPRGTEMEELPLSRMRRRKRANRGDARSDFSEKFSSVGTSFDVGIRFLIFCMNSMLPMRMTT